MCYSSRAVNDNASIFHVIQDLLVVDTIRYRIQLIFPIYFHSLLSAIIIYIYSFSNKTLSSHRSKKYLDSRLNYSATNMIHSLLAKHNFKIDETS